MNDSTHDVIGIKRMPFVTAAQAVLLNHYCEGYFRHLLAVPSEADFVRKCEETDAPLLNYFVTEFSRAEECVSLAEAIERLDATIAAIDALRACLSLACDQANELPIRVRLTNAKAETAEFLLADDPAESVPEEFRNSAMVACATFELVADVGGTPVVMETDVVDGAAWSLLTREQRLSRLPCAINQTRSLAKALGRLVEAASLAAAAHGGAA